MPKGSLLPEDTTPTTDDFTISIDSGSGTTKKTTWQNVMTMAAEYVVPYVFPVGSYYINETNSSNPSTFLPGMGSTTWVAIEGRTVVGHAATGTFNVAGGYTGGAESVALTTAQLPAHNHGVNDPGHNHSTNTSGETVFTGSSTQRVATSGAGQQITWGNTVTGGSGTGISTQNTGSGDAHTNLQPYVVAYVWKRTA